MRKIIYRTPLSLLVLLAVIYLSLFKPSSEVPLNSIPHIDKVVHICMYFGLSLTLWLDLFRYKIVQPVWGWTIGFILPCLIGGLLELSQNYFTSYRGGDWFDFMANAFGAFLASLFMFFYIRKFFTSKS